MKHFKTCSDIGCVLIGNEDWTFSVPNIGGDGETDVFIVDKEDIKYYNGQQYIKYNGVRYYLTYISSVHGKFGIYDYDCNYSDKEKLKQPIEILNGIYYLYKGDMCVTFFKKQ